MPVITADGGRSWRRRTGAQDWARWGAWFAAVAVFAACWHIMTQDTIWAFVWDAPNQMADIGGRMIPPRWSYIDQLWRPMWDTINMATIGTLLAVCIATPVAFLAARNTTPSVRFVRPLALLLIVSSRSVNAIIWALLLVTLVGPGVFAGLLAIALRSIGFLGKLIYEAIEEIDTEPVEAIRATLAGDAATLRRYYDIGFSGDLTRWRLVLTPLSSRVLAAVQRISIEGERGTVLVVERRGRDGSSRMVVTPAR